MPKEGGQQGGMCEGSSIKKKWIPYQTDAASFMSVFVFGCFCMVTQPVCDLTSCDGLSVQCRALGYTLYYG